MVEIIAPQKGEVILDPACGTAGFLISAYKHILRTNRDAKGHSTLTPDEKGRLAANFKGYDISPDMVRLSLVNLYLHGFTDPHIFEYDTLTSQDRWNEYADVILANPPFMSPKGGIKPHKRFSIQAKRSEVLFVDYMAEHLTPTGRAGIIVPEGIIFQSQTAYTELRKMLVENSLVAVISLPAGVFQPYSGVKTSILILDKSLARQAQTVAFFKVENDGFGLGAQRRAIDKNDLPQVQAELNAYLQALGSGQPVDELQLSCGLIVAKEKITANRDYNLSRERYRENGSNNHSFPVVSLGGSELFRIESGGTPKSDVDEYWNGGIHWATLVDLPASDFITEITSTQRTISELGLRESSAKMIPENSVIVSTRATIGRIAINRVPMATNQGFKNVVIEDRSRVLPEFVALALTRLVPTMDAWATGGTFKEISKSKFSELQIPLPPLEVQKEIVAEIEGYQKVIDGARAVLDNYRPHISIHPEWPTVELATVSEWITKGTTPTTNGHNFQDSGINFIKIESIDETGEIDLNKVAFINMACHESLKRSQLAENDILFSIAGTKMGITGFVTSNALPANTNQALAIIRVKDVLHPKYAFHYLRSDTVQSAIEKLKVGVAQFNLSLKQVSELQIPLPPLATQQQIVAEIEAEQALVAANRELIARFEKKIQATLARVWGEEPS